MKNSEKQYLDIFNLQSFRGFNRLFSPNLASRYRVIPLAEEGSQVTVAMANPDNREAREAILTALGPSVYVVRVDGDVIDSLLTKFCKNTNYCSLDLALWMPNKNISPEVEIYANHLADLLGAHLRHFVPTTLSNKGYQPVSPETAFTEAGDIRLEEQERSNNKELIDKFPAKKIVDRHINSLLVVRQPRWPIKNFLLILRNTSVDETAIDWTIRIARSCRAKVTILPISIPVPTMYQRYYAMVSNMDKILSPDTDFGKNLRLVAQILVNSEVNGTLRLRQESPTWQIRFELLESEYDLVVIDQKPSNTFWNWILDELTNPLLSWTERPVLITS